MARTGNSCALNLALQGGGVHGAFTWGVLDRLLEDELIEIEGISGTSAGAMNAAVLAQGFVRGGREGARKALDDFWRRIASYSTFGPIHRSAIDRMFSNWNLDQSPGYIWLDTVMRLLSPYQLNLLDLLVRYEAEVVHRHAHPIAKIAKPTVETSNKVRLNLGKFVWSS